MITQATATIHKTTNISVDVSAIFSNERAMYAFYGFFISEGYDTALHNNEVHVRLRGEFSAKNLIYIINDLVLGATIAGTDITAPITYLSDIRDSLRSE